MINDIEEILPIKEDENGLQYAMRFIFMIAKELEVNVKITQTRFVMAEIYNKIQETKGRLQ